MHIFGGAECWVHESVFEFPQVSFEGIYSLHNRRKANVWHSSSCSVGLTKSCVLYKRLPWLCYTALSWKSFSIGHCSWGNSVSFIGPSKAWVTPSLPLGSIPIITFLQHFCLDHSYLCLFLKTVYLFRFQRECPFKQATTWLSLP